MCRVDMAVAIFQCERHSIGSHGITGYIESTYSETRHLLPVVERDIQYAVFICILCKTDRLREI